MIFEKEKFHNYEGKLLDLGLSSSSFESLEKFLKKLIEANEVLNLVSRKMTFDELMSNHVVDCYLALKFFPKDIKKASDFGSGGGLPGILYALHFSEIQFDLYEKSPKKRIFLNSCKSFLNNIEVKGEISQETLGGDLIMARGFKSLLEIIELSEDFFKAQKQYFLFKGRRERIDEELLALSGKVDKKDFQIISLSSPCLEVERNLVCIHRRG